MLQIAFIRENQEKVIQALAKRNLDVKELVNEVVALDEIRRAVQAEMDNALAESNKLSKDIGDLMKNGEKAKAEILKLKNVVIIFENLLKNNFLFIQLRKKNFPK